MFRFTTLTFALAATFVAAQTTTTSAETPDASASVSPCIIQCSSEAATTAGCSS